MFEGKNNTKTLSLMGTSLCFHALLLLCQKRLCIVLNIHKRECHVDVMSVKTL